MACATGQLAAQRPRFGGTPTPPPYCEDCAKQINIELARQNIEVYGIRPKAALSSNQQCSHLELRRDADTWYCVEPDC
jgi:hypothetical protein